MSALWHSIRLLLTFWQYIRRRVTCFQTSRPLLTKTRESKTVDKGIQPCIYCVQNKEIHAQQSELSCNNSSQLLYLRNIHIISYPHHQLWGGDSKSHTIFLYSCRWTHHDSTVTAPRQHMKGWFYPGQGEWNKVLFLCLEAHILGFFFKWNRRNKPSVKWQSQIYSNTYTPMYTCMYVFSVKLRHESGNCSQIY